MGINVIPDRDNSGRSIFRPAASEKGWHYHFREFEISTSKLDSVVAKNADGSDYTLFDKKLYDANNNLIDNQINELTAVKTVLTWSPNHDYEILGGKLSQVVLPPKGVRLSVYAGPVDLGPTFCKEFCPSMSLYHVGVNNTVMTDGRASKYMKLTTEGVPVPTNKFQIIATYPVGTIHDFAIAFELFKE